MLFVDVRGSTPLAEKMDNTEFSKLMNRFYEAAIDVLVQADASLISWLEMKSQLCSFRDMLVRTMPRRRSRLESLCFELQGMERQVDLGYLWELVFTLVKHGLGQSSGRAEPGPTSPHWATT